MNNNDRAFGLDVSFWQGFINWDTVMKHEKRPDFAFIRAGQGINQDLRFERNWEHPTGLLLRGAYWLYDWRPGQPSPEEQGEAFRSIVPDDEDLPLVMDFEEPYKGWSPVPFPRHDEALLLMNKFKKAAGVKRMILYTNGSGWNSIQPLTLPGWDHWFAQWFYARDSRGALITPYRECRSVSELLSTRQTSIGPWHFWQFTSKLLGREYGMGSAGLDGNLFHGSPDDLKAYSAAYLLEKNPPPVTIEVTDEMKLELLWEAHPELHPTG